jgi:tetratricopeptide (TPR) repeat protein
MKWELLKKNRKVSKPYLKGFFVACLLLPLATAFASPPTQDEIEFLLNTNQGAEAQKLVLNAMKEPGEKAKQMGNLAWILFKTNDLNGVLALLDRAEQEKLTVPYYLSAFAIQAAYSNALILAASEDYKGALDGIDKAEAIWIKYPPLHYDKATKKFDGKVNPFQVYNGYNSPLRYLQMKEFIIKRISLGTIKPDYVQKVQTIIYTNADVGVYPPKVAGKTKPKEVVNWKYSDLDFQRIDHSNALMKLAIEAMTDGHLSLSFSKPEFIDVNYRRAKDPAIDRFVKNQPRLDMRKSLVRENSDLIIEWVNSYEIGASGHGGGNSISMEHPPASGNDWETLIHEYFHCLEGRIKVTPHGFFTPEKYPQYLDWSRIEGDGMSWYVMHFRTSVMNKLAELKKNSVIAPWQKLFQWGS